MIATIAVIAAIAETKKVSDRWDSKKSFSAIVVAAIAGKWFPYDCYDRCDRWTFFFTAITAIVTILWKPGLSYVSLLNKTRFNK